MLDLLDFCLVSLQARTKSVNCSQVPDPVEHEVCSDFPSCVIEHSKAEAIPSFLDQAELPGRRREISSEEIDLIG